MRETGYLRRRVVDDFVRARLRDCRFAQAFGRVVRVVEKPKASPSGMSTLGDLPRRSARHVFPSIHPAELDGAAS